ncbi:MAG: hypothetical protein O3A51_06765 [Verrucomicrobia bacterium]|nr:hypothetical protein [Verrucomicrobiota bacterium]
MSNLAITLCQLNSNADVTGNLEQAKAAFQAAAEHSADLLLFPENVLCRGTQAEVRTASRNLADYTEQLGSYSREFGIRAVWGGIPVARDSKLYNTSLIFDTDGDLLGHYEKIHLFRFKNNEQAIDETATFASGSDPLTVPIKDWSIGVTICYDLRFPELYRSYLGADMMICTSEFTHLTGSAHWELLLRARAVENQCFVVGVNQCGLNAAKQILAFGHSMVVDPWGTVIAAADEAPGCVHVVLDKAEIAKAQGRVPARDSVVKRIEW